MEKPQITAYLKTYCGWSAGVRAVLNKYNLPYTEKDIIANPAFRWEMETKSGQPLSPCVEINEEMLADVSGEEVEQYLTENELVKPSEPALAMGLEDFSRYPCWRRCAWRFDLLLCLGAHLRHEERRGNA